MAMFLSHFLGRNDSQPSNVVNRRPLDIDTDNLEGSPLMTPCSNWVTPACSPMRYTSAGLRCSSESDYASMCSPAEAQGNKDSPPSSSTGAPSTCSWPEPSGEETEDVTPLSQLPTVQAPPTPSRVQFGEDTFSKLRVDVKNTFLHISEEDSDCSPLTKSCPSGMKHLFPNLPPALNTEEEIAEAKTEEIVDAPAELERQPSIKDTLPPLVIPLTHEELIGTDQEALGGKLRLEVKNTFVHIVDVEDDRQMSLSCPSGAFPTHLFMNKVSPCASTPLAPPREPGVDPPTVSLQSANGVHMAPCEEGESEGDVEEAPVEATTGKKKRRRPGLRRRRARAYQEARAREAQEREAAEQAALNGGIIPDPIYSEVSAFAANRSQAESTLIVPTNWGPMQSTHVGTGMLTQSQARQKNHGRHQM